MKTDKFPTEFEMRAADALRTLFGRVSATRLLELKHESNAGDDDATIVARIDIYGHGHTIACNVCRSGEPASLRALLRETENTRSPFASDTTHLVVAPHLSPEAQAVCKEHNTGFVDFEGNANLSVGDFFVTMRSMPREAEIRSSLVAQKPALRTVPDLVFPSPLAKAARKQTPVALSA